MTTIVNGTTDPKTGRPSRNAAYEAPAAGWQGHAKCRETDDPDVFFPTGDSRLARTQEEAAKRVCGECKVRQLCLDWAVSTRQYTGVWGGLTERERRGLYETEERSFTRCLNEQGWIEEQLGAGWMQKQIARELRVDPGVLNRAIQQMQWERKMLAKADAEETEARYRMEVAA